MTTREKRTSKVKAATYRTLRNTKAARAKTPAVEPDQILGRAMLANVHISNWVGRKHDAEITAEVSDNHKAAPDAGRYHKRLFGKSKELSAIISAGSRLRELHRTETLPWSDAGWRLLPTANYMTYTDQLRKAISVFNEAADAWEIVYAQRVREAKDTLKDMWKASDYPTPAAIRAKYRVELQFSPLPASGDFRVTLPSEEMERVAQDVETRVMNSVGLAMKEAWKRLGESVTKLRGRLEDGKYISNSIEDLQEIAEALGRLNLTNDVDLETVRKQVLTELTSFDAETLKKDPAIRADAAMKADEILKAMAGVYSPSTDEEEAA